MKKLLLSLLAVCALALPVLGFAAEEGYPWDKFPAEKMTDKAALQAGARTFVNYCLSCHSAMYMRYNLSVIARSRAEAGKGSGADYLYTLWRSFYRDESRPTGWNNLAYPNIAMPHVLWQLQGERVPIYGAPKVRQGPEKTEGSHDAEKPEQVFEGWKQITPGKLSDHEYDETIADLVAYLQWMGEPAQGTRVRVGVGVLIFLGLLIVITWRLNAAFWKNVE
jgi:ubiquinol-cytochrome c reductase cytochrome c1 subunit